MIASVIEQAGDQLGQFLPRLAGALLLLILGLLAAILIGRLTRRALVRAGLDRFADRTGAGELLAQAGLGDSLAALVGTAVRLTIVIVVSFAALTLLGLEFVSDSLNEGILFIPRLLAALALDTCSESCWGRSCARGSSARPLSSTSRLPSVRSSRC